MVGDGFDNIVDVQFPSQRGAQWFKKINGGVEGGVGKSGGGKIDGGGSRGKSFICSEFCSVLIFVQANNINVASFFLFICVQITIIIRILVIFVQKS